MFVDLLCPDCAAAWPNMKSGQWGEEDGAAANPSAGGLLSKISASQRKTQPATMTSVDVTEGEACEMR